MNWMTTGRNRHSSSCTVSASGSFFGSNISPGAFHAVFLNPPYLSVLSENGGRSRDEKRFLIESIPLLMMGGLLIYIVPYYRLTADLCGIICDNFEQVRIHRFLDREFKQFKQVVVTGVRRRRTERNRMRRRCAPPRSTRRPYLPPTFCPRLL